MIVVPVSVCPSPFPRTTVLVPIPSILTEDFFRGRPARPEPNGTLGPGLPVGLLSASRPLFCDLPPPSLFHGHDLCRGLVSP